MSNVRRRNVIRMAFKAILVKWGIPDRRAEHCQVTRDRDAIHG